MCVGMSCQTATGVRAAVAVVAGSAGDTPPAVRDTVRTLRINSTRRSSLTAVPAANPTMEPKNKPLMNLMDESFPGAWRAKPDETDT